MPIMKIQANELFFGTLRDFPKGTFDTCEHSYGSPGWWGTKQELKFWRHPMNWLKNKLWDWLNDGQEPAHWDDFLALSNKSRNTNKMISRLCDRVQLLEDIETEYAAEEGSVFDDVTLKAIFDRLQSQADVVNATQHMTIDLLEDLGNRLYAVEEKTNENRGFVTDLYGQHDDGQVSGLSVRTGAVERKLVEHEVRITGLGR